MCLSAHISSSSVIDTDHMENDANLSKHPLNMLGYSELLEGPSATF